MSDIGETEKVIQADFQKLKEVGTFVSETLQVQGFQALQREFQKRMSKLENTINGLMREIEEN